MEERPMEEQVREKTIPVFTVVKNGAILKNIFVVNSRDLSSPERNSNTVCDDDDVEEILVVGRHPDCDILLTHPSISRFHLEIRSVPSRQKLFVTDLSSVHGTWVMDQKVEPDACVEVKEGDVIRIGGSTRIYRLHWIPLSRAYDIDSPFVSPLDISTAMKQEEEDRMLETENPEAAHQSLEKTALGDDGALHLDVTSEETGSSVPSEDEDTNITTREISLALASHSVLQASKKWDSDVVEAVAEKPSRSCSPSKQQSGVYAEGLDCTELEVAAEAYERDFRGEGGLHLNVMSVRMETSVPNEDEDSFLAAKENLSLPFTTDSTETEKLHLTEDVLASAELAINMLEANAENPSSCFPSKGQIDGCFEASGSSSVEEAVAEKPSRSCSPSKQQSGVYAEGLDCTELEVAAEAYERDFRGGGLHLNVMSVRMETSVPNEVEDSFLAAKENLLLPFTTDSTETEKLHLTEDVLASAELAINMLEANAENPSSSCFPSKGQIDGCFEASGSSSAFDLASEVKILSFGREVNGGTEFVTEKVMEVSAETWSHEDNGETEVLMQVIAASPSSFSQAKPTLETFTKEAQGLVGSEFQSEMAIETENENLQSTGEMKVGSRQANAVSDCFFTGNKRLSRINTEDIQSMCSSWQPLSESELGVPSEIWSEVNPHEDQNKNSGMTRETEKILEEGSNTCLSEDLRQSGTQSLLLTPNQKAKIKLSIGSGRSEESYSPKETEGKENADNERAIFSTLAAETSEDTKLIKERPSDSTGSRENQFTQKRDVRDDVLSEMDSSRSSQIRLNTCNIWSRRGKAASILQLRTNKSGKKIENQPKAQLHRKQALSDKSVSLAVHHVAEKLEPEIFTPDKENLSPSSHMLKRLQNIGDVKDSKISSSFSGNSSASKIPSSFAIVTSGALTEPEIFTPDKENLTPNSHKLKRLREIGEIKETKGSSSKATRKPFCDIHVEESVMEEQKPYLHSMSSKSKVNHEPVELMVKSERVPFQPRLDKPSSQSQSHTEAFFTASARNSISRGIRSSSILSDAKSKMKWTIVLDTSSLLDKESRKPLHLLQGLKGTHLVVPRTVLRELNETKLSRSLLYRRRREIASSAMDWIEECKVNTKWWIQLQSPSEETKATATTPPVTPQSNGSSAFPFSLQWNNNNAPEIDSPTSEDQVLECALIYRNRNSDEKLVLISNDASLKIKAMAEGVICETAHEFYESLTNPFSERFMWRESSARGRTWSHIDDVVLRERYKNKTCFPYRKKSTYDGGRGGEVGAAAKGLKLILLHNSHYGHIQ